MPEEKKICQWCSKEITPCFPDAVNPATCWVHVGTDSHLCFNGQKHWSEPVGVTNPAELEIVLLP